MRILVTAEPWPAPRCSASLAVSCEEAADVAELERLEEIRRAAEEELEAQRQDRAHRYLRRTALPPSAEEERALAALRDALAHPGGPPPAPRRALALPPASRAAHMRAIARLRRAVEGRDAAE